MATRVKVVARGDNFLSFQVKAPGGADAPVQLANALATAYIHYVSKAKLAAGTPVQLGSARKTTPRSPVISPIDAVGGLVAGLAIASVVLWKDRREWRDVQLIYG
jgi:hypothetical protein